MSHYELHRSTTAVTTIPEERIFLVDRKAATKAPEAHAKAQMMTEAAHVAFARDALASPPSEDRAPALAQVPTDVLVAAAQTATRQWASRAFNFCAIVNAKSGRCTENCAWCAQSRHFKADVAQYPLIDEAKALEAARKAAAAGCSRFSLVTSGRKLSAREVRETAALVRAIRRETNLEVCLSSGLLKQSELEELRRAGASRFHCNLEAAAPVFKKLCTTHTTEDKIATLAAARRAGMDVCSGGIIGMGETESDRIDLALTLRRLEIPSIPINVLVPIAGTPLETASLISDEEILRTVAIFRLINPSAWLRFAGGRARLSESLQLAAMKAGINSAIAGDMLTTAGTAVDNDRRLVAQAAYGFEEDDVRAVDAAHIWHPYAGTVTPPPVEVVAAARGTRITLADGRELIDGISSWWCAAFGHNPPEVVNAIRRQSETLSHVMFAGFTHKPAADLAQKLIALAPKGLQKVFFVDSGSVAVEAAMKMALHYQVALGQGTRTNFFALEAGYHGDTANAMSVSDPEAAMHRIYQSALPKRIFIASPQSRFDGEWQDIDRERLEKAFAEHAHEAAGFILEPIVQAANAMRFYHPEYLRHARRLCTEYGVVLIADEIATGFGRTGRTFASDWAGITPDIMTVGKALTAGVLPLAAVLATNPLADAVSSIAGMGFMHGPTFMANPLACAAAGAALDLYASRDWAAEVRRIEAALKAELEVFRTGPAVRDVRVCGAIGVVELDRTMPAAAVQHEFVSRGVWIRPIGNLLYLMPPYITTNAEIHTLAAAMREVLNLSIKST